MNITATFGEGRLMVSPPKDCPPWIARRNHQFSPPARSNSAQQLSDFAKTPQRESVVPESMYSASTKTASHDSMPVNNQRDVLIAALQKLPSGRSSEEIAVLCDFLRHLHDGLLISRLPTATLHQLCVTSVTLSAYVKGEILFKRGAASDACYQLLSGAVGVYAPLPDHPQEKNVAILRAGDHKTCFGEIGVLEDLPRSATLIAETDVQCVVINKTAFDETLKKVYLSDLDDKVSMISHLPLFQRLLPHELRTLCYFMTEKEFNPHQTIFKFGEVSDLVYFVIKGDCLLSRPGKGSIKWQVTAQATGGAVLGLESAVPTLLREGHGRCEPIVRTDRCTSISHVRLMEITASDLLRHINNDVVHDIRAYLLHTSNHRRTHLEDSEQVRQNMENSLEEFSNAKRRASIAEPESTDTSAATSTPISPSFIPPIQRALSRLSLSSSSSNLLSSPKAAEVVSPMSHSNSHANLTSSPTSIYLSNLMFPDAESDASNSGLNLMSNLVSTSSCVICGCGSCPCECKCICCQDRHPSVSAPHAAANKYSLPEAAVDEFDLAALLQQLPKPRQSCSQTRDASIASLREALINVAANGETNTPMLRQRYPPDMVPVISAAGKATNLLAPSGTGRVAEVRPSTADAFRANAISSSPASVNAANWEAALGEREIVTNEAEPVVVPESPAASPQPRPVSRGRKSPSPSPTSSSFFLTEGNSDPITILQLQAARAVTPLSPIARSPSPLPAKFGSSSMLRPSSHKALPAVSPKLIVSPKAAHASVNSSISAKSPIVPSTIALDAPTVTLTNAVAPPLSMLSPQSAVLRTKALTIAVGAEHQPNVATVASPSSLPSSPANSLYCFSPLGSRTFGQYSNSPVAPSPLLSASTSRLSRSPSASFSLVPTVERRQSVVSPLLSPSAGGNSGDLMRRPSTASSPIADLRPMISRPPSAYSTTPSSPSALTSAIRRSSSATALNRLPPPLPVDSRPQSSSPPSATDPPIMQMPMPSEFLVRAASDGRSLPVDMLIMSLNDRHVRAAAGPRGERRANQARIAAYVAGEVIPAPVTTPVAADARASPSSWQPYAAAVKSPSAGRSPLVSPTQRPSTAIGQSSGHAALMVTPSTPLTLPPRPGTASAKFS